MNRNKLYAEIQPDGFCHHCHEPIADGLLYCDGVCGKAYRYHAGYKVRQAESTREYRKRQREKQNAKEHVCTKKCVKRFGFCIQARNERRRNEYKGTKIIPCIHRASFVRGAA